MSFIQGFLRREATNDERPYRERDPELLTPDIVYTFMDAADQRPEIFSLDLLERSLEAATKRGHIVRSRHIRKELRWLAKQAAKEGIEWDVKP